MGTNIHGEEGIETVIQRGPHTQIHQLVTHEGDLARTNHWVTLQPGLNYWNPAQAQWIPSEPIIDLLPNGAQFTRGQFNAVFSANHNDASGASYLILSGNRVVKLQTVGISLIDFGKGQNVWLGVKKDSMGLLNNEGNMLLYPDAFDGFKADVRITVGVDRYQSDVILREQLPDLAEFNFNPNDTYIEVWHEIVEAPPTSVRTNIIHRPNGVFERDEQLDFGVAMIGQGSAFLLGANQVPLATRRGRLPVGKELFQDPANPSDYLIERVPYTEAIEHISMLPEREEARVSPESLEQMRRNATPGRRGMPTRLVVQKKAPSQARPRLVAGITRSEFPGGMGYNIDYSVQLSASNLTITNGTTMHVTNEVVLTGLTTAEGASVFKFSSGGSLKVEGSFDCQSFPGAPIILTSKDDNSVGETIAASTGSPSGNYATHGLHFPASNTNVVNLHDIQTRFAANGITIYSPGSHNLANIQAVQCANGLNFKSNTVAIQNFLAHGGTNSIYAEYSTVSAEHVTARNPATRIFSQLGTSSSLSLKNSLIVGSVGASTNVTGTSVTSVSSDAGIFEIAGAGYNYLAASSPYRNSGTTSLTPAMLAILKKTTTFAPTVLSNQTITIDSTFWPVVQRDTDTPDLGFHYYPIDYVMHYVQITNAVLTLTNGVHIGTYYDYTIAPVNGGALISHGNVLQPNRFVDYALVQEQPIAIDPGGASFSPITLAPYQYSATVNSADVRFTEFIGYRRQALYESADFKLSTTTIRECRFLGNDIYVSLSTAGPVGTLINNQFWRSTNTMVTPSLYACSNNFFFRSSLNARAVGSTNNLVFSDTVFDSSTITGAPFTLSHTHTAYINSTGVFRPNVNVLNDITLSSFAYAAGTFGNFYHFSTNFLNTGSQTAPVPGLFHFTTQGSNTSETNSVVDRGFHYVADVGGAPLDSDGDGVWDYLEDFNGNGTVDSGELNFNQNNLLGGSVGLTVFTPLN